MLNIVDDEKRSHNNSLLTSPDLGGQRGPWPRTHNGYQTIVGHWWIVGMFVFLTLFFTDDIIKGSASQKERKNYLYK
jgi:hypothetical protein